MRRGGKKSVALIEVGRIRRPWGVKGELAVGWNNEAPPVKLGGRVFLKTEGSKAPLEFEVERLKNKGSFYALGLKGIETRSDAKQVTRGAIWVEEIDLPPLKKDEYYSYQIIGMKVKTENGQDLGAVEEIMSTGSNDVYVVRGGGREFLIPAIKDVVMSVDVKSKKMIIREIEGLLE